MRTHAYADVCTHMRAHANACVRTGTYIRRRARRFVLLNIFISIISKAFDSAWDNKGIRFLSPLIRLGRAGRPQAVGDSVSWNAPRDEESEIGVNVRQDTSVKSDVRVEAIR